jgi:hypothetical protein
MPNSKMLGRIKTNNTRCLMGLSTFGRTVIERRVWIRGLNILGTMSASPPKADIDRHERHVRFVPQADFDFHQ